MQVTIAMVSAVMGRTEQLLLEHEEAQMVQNLLSAVRLIVERYLFLLLDHEDELNQDKAKQKEILELAFDIENFVESYLVTTRASSRGRRIKSFFKRSHSKRLLDALRGFNSRVEVIWDSLVGFPVSPVLMSQPPVARTTSWTDRASTSSVLSGVDDFEAPSEVIVVERDVQKLLSILLSNDKDVASSSFFSICGKRGVGKTTLAKLVYDHHTLVEHFDCRAWASVRADAPIRDILESILISLSPTPVKKEAIARMDEMQLSEKVYEAQRGRRCFIVFDDVSTIDTIKFGFPMSRGTIMLITTLSSQVAGQLNGYIHHMQELNLEESNLLFKRQSQISEHQEGTENQMEIGAQIAGACGGIPLAISVLGRILKGKNLDEWKRVLERLQGAGDLVTNVLCLSYKYLPSHLKPCFLYLGHLLDQVMPVEKLYLLWIAEGLVSKESLRGNRRMDVAEEYLKKLIFTSLVIAETEKESTTRRFKSCQLQGLVHDICVSFGLKENFFQVINTSYQAEVPSSVNRVAVYLNRKGDSVSLKISEPKKMRALLFFETDESPPARKWPAGVADLAAFRWMRVLNFDKVDFRVKKVPYGLGKLLYLRYLSFQGCLLDDLPSFVSKLKLLEILDLRVAKACKMKISDKNILERVRRLSHLYLPSVFQTSDGTKLKLNTLRRLELLENFNSMSCDIDDLFELTLVQVVTVNVTVGLPKDLNKIIEFVHKHQHLHQVSLVIKNFDCSHSEERLLIFEALWGLNTLHALHVEGHMKKLPMDLDMDNSRLTKIVFDESEFDTDPMPILGRLCDLRSLVLKNDAFVGDSMCCKSGFLKLRRLELKSLRFLKNWAVMQGAMPKLSVLVIKDCIKLAMAPVELMDTGTLRELKIISMPKNFEETVRKIFKRMEGLILTFDN